MHLKEQILSQQQHENMSTTLRMSRAWSYRVWLQQGLLGAFGTWALSRAVLCASGCSCADAKQAGLEAV